MTTILNGLMVYLGFWIILLNLGLALAVFLGMFPKYKEYQPKREDYAVVLGLTLFYGFLYILTRCLDVLSELYELIDTVI
jgi:hypothetical protein